jgi:hypothetical protein
MPRQPWRSYRLGWRRSSQCPFRLALRQDAINWLRGQRAQLHLDLLTEAQAEQEWLKIRIVDC